ncbi:MAG: carboxypeptidase regulatory-like domain-containing protein [Candidatus Eisenbacteria bacterium]|uniref:Carboxypeptidase regulatory-like domain-containing protein n=1 Tax=Eiseniibacteriota bacterium TaxID=2212470 RepID=A0A937XCF1_UNCEI|nr:carboxypeptidase regulatory-like domain-containing protein [Candidatus Eisenbacteria bacterium]
MKRILAAALLAGLVVAALAAPAPSAQPAAAPGEPPPAPAPASDPGARRAQAVLHGAVTDGRGTPLAGAAVKIFEEGFLLAEGLTGPDGAYEVPYSYVPDIDWTLVAWFVPAGEALIPEIYILRESLRSKTRELWSACLPRVEVRPHLRLDASLVDREAKLQQMGECLGQQER